MFFKMKYQRFNLVFLLRNGTETRDANTVVGLLKLYLANNNIEYKEDDEENREIKRFLGIIYFVVRDRIE